MTDISVEIVSSGVCIFDNAFVDLCTLSTIAQSIWSYHSEPLLLLSYDRRLRMTSEALEIQVERCRDSHSWCMDVVSHGYSGLGGGRDGGGPWYACGTKPEGLVACREMPEHFPSTR